MNTQHEQDGSQNIHAEEDIVIDAKPADDASQEEKDAYYEKLESSNKQLYARAKKAEGFVQKDGKWVKPEKPADANNTQQQPAPSSTAEKLTSLDVYALMDAKVPQADIQDVAEYAAFKKISVTEALTHPLMKTMLAEKAEARRVAEGTATGSARRGSATVSDELLLENASKGIMPEKPEDMSRLAALRMSGQKKKS